MKTRQALLGIVALALAGALGVASAQDHHGHDHDHDRGPGPGRPVPGHGGPAFDARYHHDRYYPAHGYVTATLPLGAVNMGSSPLVVKLATPEGIEAVHAR